MSQDLADSTAADGTPDVAERALVVKRFGPLEVCVVSRYTRTWDDRGSGGDYHGSFFSPVAPGTGWRRLAHLGNGSNHNDISGNHGTVMVREVDAAARMFAHPTDYRLIWTDAGSGADKDGSVWRPVPPAGYVALGDVMWQGHGKPPLTEITCIRKTYNGHEYVRRGTLGPLLWSDKGTGADRDVSLYPILAPGYPEDSIERLLLPTGGFTAYGHHSPPSPEDTTWVLDLPASVVKSHGPQRPTLTSHDAPPETTQPVIDRVVVIPCTVVRDPHRAPAWQLEHSPFYTLERRRFYTSQLHRYNGSSEPHTDSRAITTGVSGTDEEAFTKKTGVTVSASAGIEVKGLGLGASVSTTVELGYERRRSVTVLRSETKTHSLVTPPHTSGALWSETHEIRSFRADGSQVGETSLIFETSNYVNQQYPAGTDISHTVTD
ncbi:Vps62-related protein [Saccharothrix xinjiangensis]|uniref:Vps62-related protein n=1 Tax=Saccharothrix xinjiangensis TaxID=204798 RepID=A0ABV9Y4Y2_9PSEU